MVLVFLITLHYLSRVVSIWFVNKRLEKHCTRGWRLYRWVDGGNSSKHFSGVAVSLQTGPYKYTRVHTCMHTRTHTRSHLHTHGHTHACTLLQVHMYAHTYLAMMYQFTNSFKLWTCLNFQTLCMDLKNKNKLALWICDGSNFQILSDFLPTPMPLFSLVFHVQIIAFLLLRNSSQYLRCVHNKVLSLVGRISLEVSQRQRMGSWSMLLYACFFILYYMLCYGINSNINLWLKI